MQLEGFQTSCIEIGTVSGQWDVPRYLGTYVLCTLWVVT